MNNAKQQRKTREIKDQTSLQENWRYQGNISRKNGHYKGKKKNGKELTEAEEINKSWQEYTEELYKKGLNRPDNHNGVVPHLRARYLGV